MTTNQPARRSGSGSLNAIKFFIVTAMLAVTVGLWSLISRQAVEANVNASGQVSGISAPAASGLGLDLPPIPTLVSYDSAALIQNNQPAQPAVVQRPDPPAAPFFQQNQASPRPLTNTGSSR